MITMLNIGENGRLGNQIFQYVFLRVYSIFHDLELKLPNNKNFILKDLFENLKYNTLRKSDKINMIHYEPYFHFNNKLFLNKRKFSIDFIGWFQSIKYSNKKGQMRSSSIICLLFRTFIFSSIQPFFKSFSPFSIKNVSVKLPN